MRMIDADKLEEQFKELIERGKQHIKEIDINENPDKFAIWRCVLQDRCAYLYDLLKAETIPTKIFTCQLCYFKTQDPRTICPGCELRTTWEVSNDA